MRLHVLVDSPEQYVFIGASRQATAPTDVHDPSLRKVFHGRLRNETDNDFYKAPYAFQLLDIDSSALKDGEAVYYHVYEKNGNAYEHPLSIECTPVRMREAVAQIARDALKKRLRYHLDYAVESGVITGCYHVPILEQEVREEGEEIPAIYLKERVNPQPQMNTVGNQAGHYIDKDHAKGAREFHYSYSSTVDIFVLTDNPEQRTDLEQFLRGALDSDRELYLALGLEAPQFSAFTRHDVDEQAGTDIYASEISMNCTTTVRISEKVIQNRPAVVWRKPRP